VLYEAVNIRTWSLSLKGCNASGHQRIKSSRKQWWYTEGRRFWIGKLLHLRAQATFNQSCCDFVVPSSWTFVGFYWIWSICWSLECRLCICRTSSWKTNPSRENRGKHLFPVHGCALLWFLCDWWNILKIRC